MSARGALSVLGVAMTLSACGGSPPPPPPPPPPKPTAAPATPPKPVVAAQPAPAAKPAQPVKPGQPAIKPGQPAAPVAAAKTTPTTKPGTPAATPQVADVMKSAGDTMTPPKPKYEVRNRRDPFQNLELAVKEREGTGGFSVAATKLTGIVQGRGTPLALVETSEGHGYILKPGDTLGDGRLIEIGTDSVVFVVTPKPGSPSSRVVLRLPGN